MNSSSCRRPSADFVEQVIGICRDRRIDLVIPIIDYEFVGWAQAAGRLAESGTQVAISPVPALRICEEKDKTLEYFRGAGIPAITTWRAEEIIDPTTLPFPVYLKPRCGRAAWTITRHSIWKNTRSTSRRCPTPSSSHSCAEPRSPSTR